MELPSEEELQQRWDEVMDLLSEEDREHLEKEADGATLEEKFGMLQQVCAGLHLLFLNSYYCARRLSRSLRKEVTTRALKTVTQKAADSPCPLTKSKSSGSSQWQCSPRRNRFERSTGPPHDYSCS